MSRQEIDDLQHRIEQCRHEFQDKFNMLLMKRCNIRYDDEMIIKINNEFTIVEDEHDLNIKALVMTLQDMIKKQVLLEKEELEAPFRSIGIHESSVITKIMHIANLIPGFYRCSGINPSREYASTVFDRREVNGMCYFCGKKSRSWLSYDESLGFVRHC